MKEKLTRAVRKTLPPSTVHQVEERYRKARARLLAAQYGNPAKSLKVIGVTGTNGKTTTVNYLNEILKESGKKTAMFSTAVIEVAGKKRINDLNATVASVATMQKFFLEAKKARVDYVVMEFPSHALAQHKLAGVPVEMAIMTNLTQDHLDYHGTMQNYAAAKAKLFQLRPQYIVLNRDDEWFDYFNKFPAAKQTITYGQHVESEAHIDRIKLFRKGSEANITIDHQTKVALATALPGEFNVYNMVAASAAAYVLGIPLKDIVEGSANLEAVPGRFERIEEGQDCDIVVDYAHTPDAIEKLLSAARSITKNRVFLVFGATGDRDKAKRPIMGTIAARLADRIVLTDEESYNENPDTIRAMVRSGIESTKGSAKMMEIPDRRAAIKKALSVARKGDTVLITGMGHEQFRIVNGKRLPWNDSAVVREILAELASKKK